MSRKARHKRIHTVIQFSQSSKTDNTKLFRDAYIGGKPIKKSKETSIIKAWLVVTFRGQGGGT